jgi:hypothetical protein
MRVLLLMLAVGLLTPAGFCASGGEPELKSDPGRKIYVGKCAKCHKFYDPAKYSDEEWQKWFGKMSRKAKLTGEQKDSLARYIDNSLRSHTSRTHGETGAGRRQ